MQHIFIKKYEIKLAPLLKKFPKSHYGNNIGSETSASTDFIVMINFAFVLFNACSIHITDDRLLHFNIFMKSQMLSISLIRYETFVSQVLSSQTHFMSHILFVNCSNILTIIIITNDENRLLNPQSNCIKLQSKIYIHVSKILHFFDLNQSN